MLRPPHYNDPPRRIIVQEKNFLLYFYFLIRRMKLAISFLVCFFYSLNSTSQVITEINGQTDTIYPLNLVESENFTDLLPLKDRLQHKKVIGMGEATHGTQEFFSMKAKMFKFLVLFCGFRVFSIEATYGGTLKVNEYVRNGTGDVLTAMKGMEFWTWDTEEVRDLIEWIRQFNIGKEENNKISFYGFDCQSYKGPANSLTNYIQEVDANNISNFKKGLAIFHDSSASFFRNSIQHGMDASQADQMNHSIEFLIDWFAANEHRYIAKLGEKKFLIAKYNIENLKQTFLLFKNPEQLTQNSVFRDSCMAQNIQWISKLENRNVFAWAHNGHVARYPYLRQIQSPFFSMGDFLQTIYGNDYYNIGFVFREGAFQAIYQNKLQECAVGPLKKHKLTNEFLKAGYPTFFIDLEHSKNKVFSRFQFCYEYGATFDNQTKNISGIRPKESFDGLIFVQKTNCVKPILRN